MTSLMRFNSDGSIDTSFGTSGVAVLGALHEANGFVRDQDGNIYLAAKSSTGISIKKFGNDGAADTNFATSGTLELVYPSTASAGRMLLTSDGSLVAVGSDGSDVFVARMSLNGILDNSFGVSGVLILNIGVGLDQAWDVIEQDDGDYIIIGSTSDGSMTDFFLKRVAP